VWRPGGRHLDTLPKVSAVVEDPVGNATMVIIPEGAAKKSGRQFAGNRIMLKPIRTGFTFRFRKW
jgi:hypothetical protein